MIRGMESEAWLICSPTNMTKWNNRSKVMQFFRAERARNRDDR